METRPPIPAEIRRRVLVEAGHRCAIPTCRYIECDVHHIIPWSESQAHEYDNLIALCPNCHRRSHKGGDIDRKSLRLYKFNLRFVHDKYSQLEIDLLFELIKSPVDQGLQWPVAMLIMLKRVLEAQLVFVHSLPGSISTFGVDMTPKIIALTDKGRAFIKEIGIHEM